MIICFAHYKGGTGKTTSCLSVAGFLALRGYKVLVVDLDPQGNATSGLGVDKDTINKNMYHVMKKNEEISRIIVAGPVKGLHIAPAKQELELAALRAYRRKTEAQVLINALEKVKGYYDFILIDTPPVHGHFIINGLAAADKVIVVLDPGVFALEGIETLQNAFGNFFDKLGLKLSIDAALITRAPGFKLFRKNYALEMKKEVEILLGRKVYMIPYSDNVYDCHVWGLPISHLKPGSKVGQAYSKVVDDIIEEYETKHKVEGMLEGEDEV